MTSVLAKASVLNPASSSRAMLNACSEAEKGSCVSKKTERFPGVNDFEFIRLYSSFHSVVNLESEKEKPPSVAMSTR